MLQEITAGIYRLILPLPFALNSVNVYLLQDGDGWTIVDTGLNTTPARDLWHKTWADLNIKPGDVRRIFLTHTHPDHFGLAGWLQRELATRTFTPPVLMSAKEAEFAGIVWRGDWNVIIPSIADHFYRFGLSRDEAMALAEQTISVGKRTQPTPEVVEVVNAGSSLAIGARNFQLIHAPGHSDGQLLLYDEADRLLLCGDQVLAKITPNIGLWLMTVPNPLAQFLDSIASLKTLAVRLALSGHRQEIENWVERITEIETHHEERLKITYDAVKVGATVEEISRVVFEMDQYALHDTRFALAETLAHLEYLVKKGDLQKSDELVWRFSS